jgi:hypothetical protein
MFFSSSTTSDTDTKPNMSTQQEEIKTTYMVVAQKPVETGANLENRVWKQTVIDLSDRTKTKKPRLESCKPLTAILDNVWLFDADDALLDVDALTQYLRGRDLAFRVYKIRGTMETYRDSPHTNYDIDFSDSC